MSGSQPPHFPPGKRKIDYWDTAIPGFVLECRSSGSGTYALRYVDGHGSQRQHRIGTLGVMHFEDARKAARKLRSDVELGGDPAATKAVKKAIPLYNELADQHLARARTYVRRPADIETILRLHLRPRWGRTRINEIKPQDFALWLAELRDTGLAPATVEKIRVTLHRSFELAAKWQIPGAVPNPVRSVPRPKFSNAKERYLSPTEAARLVAACEQSSNPQLANIVWLSPNPDTLEPFVSIKRAWMTARAEAGLPELRIHDLRHSAGQLHDQRRDGPVRGRQGPGTRRLPEHHAVSHLANDTLLAAVEAGAARMQGEGRHDGHRNPPGDASSRI